MDLGRQHRTIAAELTQAFERVVGASSFVLGEEVEAFEREFASACEAGHCVGVASGTAALTIAFQAAGIGPGDEVVVPAHTFIASALGAVHAGATPVFCEVEDGTGLIDPAAAEAVIGERTAAIVGVHLYGQMCDVRALSELAAKHGLALIEDAAQAHGASRDGFGPGRLSTAAAYSFYPSKNLGALGDAGAIVTGDEALAQRARELRNLGQRAKGEHLVTGWNERLDGLQAALLRAKLPHLPAWSAARRAHAAAYGRALSGSGLRLLGEAPGSEPVYHLYPVRTPARDALAAELAAAGVGTGVHYSPACYAQPPFAGSAPVPGSFPVADAWAAEELSLPMFPELTAAEIEAVAESCRAFAGAAAR
jgi:dTDP-4-amino-4,6-dideoxygalactose transaminase